MQDNIPQDDMLHIIEPIKNVPLDFAPDIEDQDDPLTILLRRERNGEFLFSEANGPYANLY